MNPIVAAMMPRFTIHTNPSRLSTPPTFGATAGDSLSIRFGTADIDYKDAYLRMLSETYRKLENPEESIEGIQAPVLNLDLPLYQGDKSPLVRRVISSESHPANLSYLQAYMANMQGADLTNAKLIGANLRLADLDDANLTMACLKGADLWSAKLTGANLTGADLTDANLRTVDLKGTNLSDTEFERARYLDKIQGWAEAYYYQGHPPKNLPAEYLNQLTIKDPPQV